MDEFDFKTTTSVPVGIDNRIDPEDAPFKARLGERRVDDPHREGRQVGGFGKSSTILQIYLAIADAGQRAPLAVDDVTLRLYRFVMFWLGLLHFKNQFLRIMPDFD
jgi:hypothetical protein